MLSIVIITHNRVEHLRRLLLSLTDSLLKFEYQYEVVVLDNASTETLNQAEVKEIQENFSFRLIRHPINIGFARNYLYAFREARGEWCWVVGDDDQYDFDHILESYVQALSCTANTAAHLPISLIHLNQSHFVDDNGSILVLKSRVHAFDVSGPLDSDIFLDIISDTIGGLLYVSSNIFRVSTISNLVNEDYLVSYASSCVCLATPLLALRKGQVYVVSEPFISNRLQGTWSMDSSPEQVFRLELPCAIFASNNSSAIERLVLRRLRPKTFLKILIVGLTHRDFKKTFYFFSRFLLWKCQPFRTISPKT